MKQQHSLVSDCVGLLEQGIGLLETLDPETYRRTQGLPTQSGVGVHFRHCLDYTDALLRAVGDRSAHEPQVDYNRRERDERLEQYPSSAATKMRAAVGALENLAAADGGLPLLVSCESETTLTDGHSAAWCRSTLLRELQFIQSHLTHHYALIALLLRAQGIEPGVAFGVTPSTLAYWKQREEALCAR